MLSQTLRRSVFFLFIVLCVAISASCKKKASQGSKAKEFEFSGAGICKELQNAAQTRWHDGSGETVEAYFARIAAEEADLVRQRLEDCRAVVAASLPQPSETPNLESVSPETPVPTQITNETSAPEENEGPLSLRLKLTSDGAGQSATSVKCPATTAEEAQQQISILEAAHNALQNDSECRTLSYDGPLATRKPTETPEATVGETCPYGDSGLSLTDKAGTIEVKHIEEIHSAGFDSPIGAAKYTITYKRRVEAYGVWRSKDNTKGCATSRGENGYETIFRYDGEILCWLQGWWITDYEGLGALKGFVSETAYKAHKGIGSYREKTNDGETTQVPAGTPLSAVKETCQKWLDANMGAVEKDLENIWRDSVESVVRTVGCTKQNEAKNCGDFQTDWNSIGRCIYGQGDPVGHCEKRTTAGGDCYPGAPYDVPCDAGLSCQPKNPSNAWLGISYIIDFYGDKVCKAVQGQ